jgi:hypothetical protein
MLKGASLLWNVSAMPRQKVSRFDVNRVEPINQ